MASEQFLAPLVPPPSLPLRLLRSALDSLACSCRACFASQPHGQNYLRRHLHSMEVQCISDMQLLGMNTNIALSPRVMHGHIAAVDTDHSLTLLKRAAVTGAR